MKGKGRKRKERKKREGKREGKEEKRKGKGREKEREGKGRKKKNFPLSFKHTYGIPLSPTLMTSRATLSAPFSHKNNLISIILKVPSNKIKIPNFILFEAPPSLPSPVSGLESEMRE